MAYPLLSLNFYSCANGTLTMDKEREGEGQMISGSKKKWEHNQLVHLHQNVLKTNWENDYMFHKVSLMPWHSPWIYSPTVFTWRCEPLSQTDKLPRKQTSEKKIVATNIRLDIPYALMYNLSVHCININIYRLWCQYKNYGKRFYSSYCTNILHLETVSDQSPKHAAFFQS